METATSPDGADFVGPIGNATDKYRSRNPLARLLLDRFLRELDAIVFSVGPSSILDVGCGEGVVTERMARVTRAQAVGVDVDVGYLRTEWSRRDQEHVSFKPASAYDLPFDDDSFDCVSAIEVLEHLERPRDALAEMARVARRWLLLSVPNEPLWRAVHLLAGRDVRSLGNTPGHINHWSTTAFERLVSEFGVVERVRRPFPWTVTLVDVGAARATPVATERANRRLGRTTRPLRRVLYFGTYERGYPRNTQVISCLRGAGVEVVEWHVPVWEDARHKFGVGPSSAAKLARAQLRLLLRRPRVDADVVLVGYPGHFDMRAAARAANGLPIVFNPMLSLYDSMVLDRGRWSPMSLPARALRAVDRDAMRRADLVVADTEAHAEFFAELSGIARDRLEVCYLGAEDSIFRPGWDPVVPFRCLFYGKLIPLHGLETILEAARLAPEIPFRIAGMGQLQHLLERERPDNVEWIRWVDHRDIPRELWSAGCALGIFGTTEKASRVIPNKAYEALACGTPLVTANTRASRELLVDEQNALLVPPGDPGRLAAAVRRLAADDGLARRLSAKGLETYRLHASEEALGPRWRALLERVIAD